MQNNRNLLDEGGNPLKELTHANLNEPLKQHNANAVKLVQTVSEFSQALGGAMECHGQNIIHLVDDFRNRTAESRGDASSMRRVWDSLLRQVEADASAHLDFAAMLQQVSRPVLEGCFHRKVQHRKVFTHRESYEQLMAKTEEKLQRARAEYKRAYGALLGTPEPSQDSELKRAYLEAHNAYVLQLRATNAMVDFYQIQCLPGLLGEIGEIYEELCSLACGCISGVSDAANDRIIEQSKRYQALGKEVKTVNAQLDLQESVEGNLHTKVAELQEEISIKRYDLGVAQLHLAAVQAQKELFGGGADAAQPDSTGNRKMSNGSTGSNTKHKWLKAFKSLKTTPAAPLPTEKGKQAMYHAVSTVVAMSRKTLESESGGHQWREYTYRKITPCDACGQVLRGHSRQGFRCRNCKANAHADCINAVQPANCPSLQPKRTAGIPLLRRQKSTAPPVDDTPTSDQNVDAIYQVLKQAGEIRGSSANSPPTPPTADHPPSGAAGPPSSVRTTSTQPCSSSTSAPHSPQRRRERLNLRMKSLSLDSPEGSAHVRHRPRDYHNAGPRESTPPRRSDSGSINRLSAPCSPGQSIHGIHKQHLRNTIRMSSVELPDDNEKSYSSASTSPCPSPHMNNQNNLNPTGKRVLPPNNLYVVLYNFDSRHRDELDLKAGYKVTVIDKSDKDWWKGKCLGGRAGFFPSTYVMRVESGQKTLQVTRNLQLADQTTLLRDQIVVQVGEEVDGVAMVRCAADVMSSGQAAKDGEVRYKETLCPLKYLQEV
ncbi:uncharacterized protein LOC106637385 [Copidosoma floridanum]|uniref:uncharacterized protein LOC106637385 n=1 Tax=Copidosoma floridanum TaxID=29053 RepID=UPI000C6F9A3C|nr:uncharacterized protein LOC106637385 [Copidosoma floridanum]